MKTRNGFVSNSSSSSFIFLGFNRDLIQDPNISKKDLVQKGVSKRALDEYVVKYIRDDAEYEAYFAGKASDSFWDDVWEHFEEDLAEDAPDGYDVCEINEGEKWIGIEISSVYEYSSKEIDLSKVDDAKEKIKKDYPNITPKLILQSSGG